MVSGSYSCDVSPFCGSVADLLGHLGLPTALPWRWAHLGPITADGVVLAEHRDGCSFVVQQTLATTDLLGRFGGYHLDVLGLDVLGTADQPPTFAGRYHTLLKRWYAYAVAYRDREGPWVSWCVPRFGPGELVIHQPTDLDMALATPDADAIVGRCKDLLQGRFVRRGRPPKPAEALVDGVHLAVEAEARKREHPRLTRAQIARDLGTDERSLRRYRAEAIRRGLIDEETRRLA